MASAVSRIAASNPIRRAARDVERRARVRAALGASAKPLVGAMLVTVAALALSRFAPSVPGAALRVATAGAWAWVFLASLFAAIRRLPPLYGATLLDRHHRLSGRLANALAFESEAAPSPDVGREAALKLAAIADAVARAEGLRPKEALRVRAPRELVYAAALGSLAVALAMLPPPAPRTASSPPRPVMAPAALSPDELDLFREVGKELRERAEDPDLAALVARYNEIVEDLASKRLDLPEAFRRLSELEATAAKGAGRDAIERELSERAQALKKSALSRAAADALASFDLDKAADALRALAKHLGQRPTQAQKEELERLRDALKKSAEARAERSAAIEQRRRELAESRLLRPQERDGGAGDDTEKRLLSQRDRELERLDRQGEAQTGSSRDLDRLDRDLAQAAEDLMRDLGLSAKDLEQGAEDLHRLSEEEKSDAAREDLRRRIEDLRRQLRESGQTSSERLAQMRRFLRLARGEGASGQDRGGQGQGESEGKASGEKGRQGSGSAQEELLILGPGGEKSLVVPGVGSQPAGGQESASAGKGNDPGRDGAERGGRDPGEGHSPNLTGPSRPPPGLGTVDVQAAGLDTGQGASRSEVIRGAADRGFRGGAYRRVYAEYRSSAEEKMRQDRVPAGANERVRRYFDLIRPRE